MCSDENNKLLNLTLITLVLFLLQLSLFFALTELLSINRAVLMIPFLAIIYSLWFDLMIITNRLIDNINHLPVWANQKYVNSRFILSSFLLAHHINNKYLTSVIFTLRSVSSRNTIIISILSIGIYTSYQISNTSILYSLLTSVCAACIFDLIVIRIPDEVKRHDAAQYILHEITSIENIKSAMLDMIMGNDRERSVIDGENYENLLKSFSCLDLKAKATSYQGINDSFLQKRQSRIRSILQTKGFVCSLHADLCIYVYLLELQVNSALTHSELDYFPDIKRAILSIKHSISRHYHRVDLDDDFKDCNSIFFPIYQDRHDMLKFMNDFIIPCQNLEFWYRRKMIRYYAFYGRPLDKFSFDFTRYCLRNCSDRYWIGDFKD